MTSYNTQESQLIIYVKSNVVAFTFFWFIWKQAEVRTVPNQPKCGRIYVFLVDLEGNESPYGASSIEMRSKFGLNPREFKPVLGILRILWAG